VITASMIMRHSFLVGHRAISPDVNEASDLGIGIKFNLALFVVVYSLPCITCEKA